MSEAKQEANVKHSKLSLTPEIAALADRTEPDSGPEPGEEDLSAEDFVAFSEKMLEEYRPAALHVFAYGSLIWNPEFEYVNSLKAIAIGWHRAFCFSLTRWRGTRELPALMLALDRGGSCAGVLYELAPGDTATQLYALMERELDAKKATNVPRWIVVDTPSGKVKALTFVVDRRGPAYAGKKSIEETADIISRAAGHWGSNAIYLQRTVEKLEHHDIKDRNLWKLQALVADRIVSLHKKETV